jgi:CheY-like chemotaxis protein
MSPPAPDLRGVCVLVVEDNADLRDLTVNILQWCGATVREAATAQQALQVAQDVSPHVVLTDIGLPDHDGYWLADQLAATGLNAIPVIALTAFRPRTGANLHRFRRWLMKPLEPAELTRVVAEVVRKSLRRAHRPDRPAASA